MTETIRASALLLDMDGTLVDSTAAVNRIWSDWAEAHGLDPEYVVGFVHGRQGQESMAALLPDRPMEENLADNRRLLDRETAELEGIVEIPGAREFLDALIDAPHALVTSADSGLARARMAASGLRMPAIAVTAERVSASKPHPEGFLAGAAALGFAPERCVAFEDSEAGITAARTAGMRVVGVGAQTRELGADWSVDDLRSVSVAMAGSEIELGLAL